MGGLARRCEKHTPSPNSFDRCAGASSRAMVEFYEDFCNNGGTIFPTTMPGDDPNLVIGLGQSIHHRKGYDATGSDIRNDRERDQTYRGGASHRGRGQRVCGRHGGHCSVKGDRVDAGDGAQAGAAPANEPDSVHCG